MSANSIQIRKLWLWSIAFGVTSVILGAMGAHALDNFIPPSRMEVYRTGVLYQFMHALALMGLASWARTQEELPRAFTWVCRLFVAGVFLFSGSLYLLVLTNTPILGAVTPLGGFSFICAWIGWGILVWKK